MTEVYFKPLYESTIDRLPILEYRRVADNLLGGIVEGLIEQGYTQEMAIFFLQSKIFRHELDGGLDTKLLEFGKDYARTIASSYYQDCKQYAEEV